MHRMIIWRRHTAKCPHRSKGRIYLKCTCPLWADGYQDGRRTFRQSLNTRDYARAVKRAAALDQPDAPVLKRLDEALKSFMDQCQSLAGSTRGKYKNALDYFKRYCDDQGEDTVTEMTTEFIDSYRASRTLSPVTWRRELQTLRQFFAFCHDRGWIRKNITSPIKSPRNIQPNDIEPYTPKEVAKLIAACDSFGRGHYERSRARAIILLLRYTALRIGDVAVLARDRVSWDGSRWRIFLRTEKTGAPVFLPIPDIVKQALDHYPHPEGQATNRATFSGTESHRNALSWESQNVRSLRSSKLRA